MKKQATYPFIKIAIVFYVLFSYSAVSAQICTGGSTGAIAWKQTFGKGNNPGPSLPAGKTNLIYTADPCPAEGFYTISNSVSKCFNNSWDTLSACCTNGDTSGYMMLINAPANAGIIYRDTATNLCGVTNYQFSTTLVNVSDPSSCSGAPLRPRLIFTIQTLTGETLVSFNTGNIPEFMSGTGPIDYTGIYFFTPSGVNSVVITISDDEAGGCGNDFAMDNIFIAPCGPNIQANIKDMNAATVDICEGDPGSTVLQGILGPGYSNPAYQWQVFNGTDWIDIPGGNFMNYGFNAANPPGNYRYRITVAESDNIASINCRIVSNEVDVNVHPANVLGTATSNSPVCINSMINLSADGGRSYQWSGPAGFISAEENPSLVATNNSAGQYTVLIADAYGCKSAVTITVNTIPAPIVVVSNAQTICLGDSVMIQASGANGYAWTPITNLSDASISNPVAKPDQTTTYTVTITDNNNCTDTASVLVVVDTKPVISAGEDKIIIKGQSVMLDGSIKDSSNVAFNWVSSPTLDNPAVLDPVVNPVVNSDYVLTATSTIGCGISSDTVSVIVYKDLYVPDAFSPNGDGHNDTWHIPALLAFPDAVVSVFNRYGEKIFESSGGNKDWDGKYKNVMQPAGTYVYVIDLKKNKRVLKGTLILVK